MTTRRRAGLAFELLIAVFMTRMFGPLTYQPERSETLGPEHKPKPHDWHKGDRR